jgi:rubredoxin
MSGKRYLKPEIAKIVVQQAQEKVFFIPGQGAKCPLCGTWAGTKTGVKGGKRYHTCRVCGWNFKSFVGKIQEFSCPNLTKVG